MPQRVWNGRNGSTGLVGRVGLVAAMSLSSCRCREETIEPGDAAPSETMLRKQAFSDCRMRLSGPWERIYTCPNLFGAVDQQPSAMFDLELALEQLRVTTLGTLEASRSQVEFTLGGKTYEAVELGGVTVDLDGTRRDHVAYVATVPAAEGEIRIGTCITTRGWTSLQQRCMVMLGYFLEYGSTDGAIADRPVSTPPSFLGRAVALPPGPACEVVVSNEGGGMVSCTTGAAGLRSLEWVVMPNLPATEDWAGAMEWVGRGLLGAEVTEESIPCRIAGQEAMYLRLHGGDEWVYVASLSLVEEGAALSCTFSGPGPEPLEACGGLVELR